MSDDHVTEEWRSVVGCERTHLVSNLGRVKRTDVIRGYGSGHVLSERVHGLGYRRVLINDGLRVSLVFVHKIVALAFLGPRPDGFEINHINFIRHDNRLSNLEYLSRADNLRHSSGRWAKKLTPEIVLEIRSLQGVDSQEAIGRRFGVGQQAVSAILRGSTWKHLLPGPCQRDTGGAG